jgi:Transposase IS66 family
MLDDLTADLEQIADPAARRLIERLLNVVEELLAEHRGLREENQRLRDENARLRDLPARPAIPAQPAADHSSEAERHTPTPRQRRPKLAEIVVHRQEDRPVARAGRPPDARFKGWVETTIQDVVVRADNVLFRREKWYCPATGQTILAPLPPGYRGQFGPGVRALVLALGYGAHVSQPKIAEFLRDVGLVISAGQVSNLLVHEHERFHAEAAAVGDAGLASSPWHHLDDTTTRVDGVGHHCHVLGNPLYTRYQTTPHKDRVSVLDVLGQGRPRRYLLDATARAALAEQPLAATTRRGLSHLPGDQVLDEATLARWLAEHVPRLSGADGKRVREALALAAARGDPTWPALLVVDDAPQFVGVTAALALCWIHEGRHYAKLEPVLPPHRTALRRFKARFWRYYRKLVAYREAPRPAAAATLRRGFDRLFATRTGYDALDRRIAATRADKAALLQVLAHPELPLHNNPAELAVRRRVRKRVVSYGPQSAAGARAWDTFQTLAATAAKLDVSFYHYLQDRLTETNALPALADLITERAATLNLGASWEIHYPSPSY